MQSGSNAFKYAKDDQFLSFQSCPLSGLKVGETKTVLVDVSNPGGASRIKAFLVKDMNTMEPLSDWVDFETKQ